jgi:site-specific recombinase XerC
MAATAAPARQLETIDADMLVAYLRSRSSFHSKVTVYGMLSVMRGFGDHLVREAVWISNPLRCMKGPTIRPYHHMPKRIAQEGMQALWLSPNYGMRRRMSSSPFCRQ